MAKPRLLMRGVLDVALGVSPAQITATSETTPADNVADPDVRRGWLGDTGGGGSDVTITFSSLGAWPFNMLHLENINFEKATLELSDDSFSSTLLSTTVTEWQNDIDSPPEPNALTYRSLTYYHGSTLNPVQARLIINDTDISDGDVAKIGRWKMGEYFTGSSESQNINIQHTLRYAQTAPLAQTRGGGFRADDLPAQREIEITYGWLHEDDVFPISESEGENFGTVDSDRSFTTFINKGYRKDLFISLYPDEGTDRERRCTMLGRIIKNSGIVTHTTVLQSGTVHTYSRLSMTIREAI